MDLVRCRRCDCAPVAPFGINRKRHGRYLLDWTANWGGPVDTGHETLWTEANPSGPYCRHCALKARKALDGQDRRSEKRERAEQTLRNVETDDCPLICAMALSGRKRSTVQREARKIGYRPGRGGMYTAESVLLMERVGLTVTPLASMDSGVSRSGTGMTLRAFAKRFDRGDFAVSVIGMSGGKRSGHIVAIRDGEIFNEGGTGRWKVRWAGSVTR